MSEVKEIKEEIDETKLLSIEEIPEEYLEELFLMFEIMHEDWRNPDPKSTIEDFENKYGKQLALLYMQNLAYEEKNFMRKLQFLLDEDPHFFEQEDLIVDFSTFEVFVKGEKK